LPEAIDTAEKALQLATTAGEMQFAAINASFWSSHRAGKSWHEPSARKIDRTRALTLCSKPLTA